MDGITLAEYLLQQLREQKSSYNEMLSSGSIGSMEDYRFMIGQLRSLDYCEELIKTAMKGIELEDE
tara:strand:- start:449 stop:646 length:198 start_codon:yes stop_codon:yes gene_type:complete